MPIKLPARKVTAPVVPRPDAPEHERARYWRENVVGLSRRELAERIGMSESRIMDIEAGQVRGDGRAIEPDAMQRYRLACAAVTLGVKFDWLTLSLSPAAPVRILVGAEATTTSSSAT